LLTWLDHRCRQAAKIIDEKHHGGDPRRALAYYVGQGILAFQKGVAPADMLEEIQTTLFASFVADFMPGPFLLNGEKPPRPLGLLLTRETANLLSAATPISIPDALWRSELGQRAIYVDVPHGAILMDGGGGGENDIIELRAILAAPFIPPGDSGQTVFLAQMTKRASEQGRGRLCGVLLPDGGISRFRGYTSGPAVDWTMKPPFAHSMLERAVLGRAGTFLRLVLSYHFFGPEDAQENVAVTPSERLRQGKPRKDESLFAMTRLRASEAVSRPKHTIPSSWSLSTRQEVTGHFKLQAHGPDRLLRRLIWVDPYTRGPDDAPQRPQGYRV
jgi:hypothetical protein